MTGPGRAGDERARDEGVSLVEVLVGMGLFGMLSTLVLGLALSTSRVTEDTRELAAVNDETRLAMERLARELRQANELLAWDRAPSAGSDTALTFWTDFNGNGVQDRGVVDPEVLTYRWQASQQQLTLTADDASGTAVTRPMLAANVTAFDLQLYSSLWQYDADGDGLTSWQELDASAGDGDGVPDLAELALVDLVDVGMTVQEDTHVQTYRTEVDLRNRSQS